MATHECFMIVPTGTYRKSLRRYSSHPDPDVGRCAASMSGFHDVRHTIEDDVSMPDPVSGDLHPHDDLRWPTVCGCDYVFGPKDRWQLFWEPLYRSMVDGTSHVLNEAPVGATWRAEWYEPHYSGPDGMAFVVQTPGGPWLLDREGWVRTGVPPRVTMNHPVKFHTGYSCRLVDGRIIDS